jgi:hypothetical protein
LNAGEESTVEKLDGQWMDAAAALYSGIAKVVGGEGCYILIFARLGVTWLAGAKMTVYVGHSATYFAYLLLGDRASFKHPNSLFHSNTVKKVLFAL